MLLFFSGALGGPRLSHPARNASTFGNWGDEGDKRATGRAFVAKQLDGTVFLAMAPVVSCVAMTVRCIQSSRRAPQPPARRASKARHNGHNNRLVQKPR